MLTMCYKVVIPGGNEQAGYSISNGFMPNQFYSSEDNFQTNGSCPSLSIEAHNRNGDDTFDDFYASLTEPEFTFSEVELSEATLGELKNAVHGKTSSWKLTNVRIEHGNIVLCLHNFGRKLWLEEQESELLRETKGRGDARDLMKNIEADYVWMFLKKTSYPNSSEFTVNEYSRKGKLKRRYVIRYHCNEKHEVDDRIAEVSEYSKKRLERIIELYWMEDEWNMLAEITEFKY